MEIVQTDMQCILFKKTSLIMDILLADRLFNELIAVMCKNLVLATIFFQYMYFKMHFIHTFLKQSGQPRVIVARSKS